MKSFTETKITTFTPEWIKKEFMVYRTLRSARKNTPEKMDKCKKCKHKFEDDEMVALGSFGRQGNKVLCQTCAEELSN